jgi:hypothetical protein
VIGKLSGVETGEDAEGKIEGSDDGTGGEAHGTGRDMEVGDKPESFVGKGGSDAGDEGFEFGLSETVEKKMGDDEIVGAGGREGEGAGVVGLEAVGVGFATFTEEMEHGRAGVYGVSVDLRIGGHKDGKEAAVSVSDHQGSFLLEETREEAQAAALEGAA